jgi:hypothetical protein
LRTDGHERGDGVGCRLGQPAQGCAKVGAARPAQKRIDVRRLDSQPKTGRQGVDLGCQLSRGEWEDTALHAEIFGVEFARAYASVALSSADPPSHSDG